MVHYLQCLSSSKQVAELKLRIDFIEQLAFFYCTLIQPELFLRLVLDRCETWFNHLRIKCVRQHSFSSNVLWVHKSAVFWVHCETPCAMSAL